MISERLRHAEQADSPATRYQTPFPADHTLENGHLAARDHAPSAGTEGLVEDAAVEDFGEVEEAVCGGLG